MDDHRCISLELYWHTVVTLLLHRVYDVVHLRSRRAELPSNMARLYAGNFTGTARRHLANALAFVYLPPPAVLVRREDALRVTSRASVRRRQPWRCSGQSRVARYESLPVLRSSTNRIGHHAEASGLVVVRSRLGS